MSTDSINLYDNVYSDFGSDVELAVRREAYGEDLGQSSWLTAREWLGFADQLGIGAGSEVLEIGSGSGGPAVHLAGARECRLTGVDINEHGVRNARALAAARGLAERARFQTVDANGPLPFPDESFDAVVSNDAMCHIVNRVAALRDWRRVLRPGGRALFTDAMVLTGVVSNVEMATRSSIGFYLFVPPGANEAMLREAGFRVLAAQDVTTSAAEVAERWHDARAASRHAGRAGRRGELRGPSAFSALRAYALGRAAAVAVRLHGGKAEGDGLTPGRELSRRRRSHAESESEWPHDELRPAGCRRAAGPHSNIAADHACYPFRSPSTPSTSPASHRSRPAQPVDAFLRQTNAVLAHDVESQLGRIKAPTQITFGKRDALTSTRFADPLKNGIKGSEVVIFENCAHAAIYENGEDFNRRTLAFLQRHAA